MDIRNVPFKETEKGFSTVLTWNIETTHDEIIALSRAILYFAEKAPVKLKGLKIREQQDLINTLFHLNTFVGKLPTLEEED